MGRLGGALEHFVGVLGCLSCVSGRLGASWASWGSFGASCGRRGGVFGASWDVRKRQFLVLWSPRGLVLRVRRGFILGVWWAVSVVILRAILGSTLDVFFARFLDDVEVQFLFGYILLSIAKPC